MSRCVSPPILLMTCVFRCRWVTTLALLMFDSCLSLRQDPRGFQEARKNRGNRGVGGMVATAPTAPVTTSRRSQAGLLSSVSDISGQISGYFGRVMMSCAHSWPLRSALHRERSGEDASAGRNCWNAQLCRGVPCVLARVSMKFSITSPMCPLFCR